LRNLLAAAAVAGAFFPLNASSVLAAPPVIGATPRQERHVAAPQIGPIRLFDTTWWIAVSARSASSVALEQIEYRARFVDGSEPRSQSGGFAVSTTEVNGRLLVTCPTRPDYEHRLRVQIRVRDRSGATSEWVTADFPPSGDAVASNSAVQVSTEAQPAQYDLVAPVEVEADNGMTIGDVRAALQRKTEERGATAAVRLRLLRSDARTMVFAADLVRDVKATPTPLSPAPDSNAEALLGTISMPLSRR
jgi:hypothetical protein